MDRIFEVRMIGYLILTIIFFIGIIIIIKCDNKKTPWIKKNELTNLTEMLKRRGNKK